ncbi:5-oxoprolinase subunit PxpA [Pseudonocardia spinosispora]|uniref:5-oxoprolinase subunit PxpA n=1 Tax=Pseudonocardia spinosispora TaxID=103441 RepID=UPI0003F66183|nr:5-oxoprolinase subunit PxpA [Pseudonocardia spinosispora]
MTDHQPPRIVDINCDLGEGFGNWVMGADADIMPLITTANVACGFHGGDPVIMGRTVELADQHGVVVGAHPGFHDLEGFGRRMIPLDPEEVAAIITYQVGALTGFLTARNMPLHHVKPHGAFYAYLRDNETAGAAAAAAVHRIAPETLVYWPAPAQGAAFCEELGALGHQVITEIYPDLSYSPEGKLIIQRRKLKTDLAFASSQVKRFLTEGVVAAEDGTPIRHEASSVCIHSDGPNAVDVAHTVRAAITEVGSSIAAIGA